jgi:hypothetical protein
LFVCFVSRIQMGRLSFCSEIWQSGW